MLKVNNYDFQIGDFVSDFGTIQKITPKAILCKYDDSTQWLPKSAIIVHRVLSGKGRLNDESKNYLDCSIEKWFANKIYGFFGEKIKKCYGF